MLGLRMEEDQVQLGLHWGGPELEGGLAELKPPLGPDQRAPRHILDLGAQDGGGPGTVGAALGPRMEEDLAQ